MASNNEKETGTPSNPGATGPVEDSSMDLEEDENEDREQIKDMVQFDLEVANQPVEIDGMGLGDVGDMDSIADIPGK